MKKKITLALFALAIAMFAAVPATFADTVTMEISFDGGATYNPLCTDSSSACSFNNYTNGNLSIRSGDTSANFPGNPAFAVSDTTSLTIRNSGTSSLSFLIRTTADGFTMPTGNNLTLTAQESATSAIGAFSFTTTGSLVGAGCSATTPTLNGVGGVEKSTLCNNSTTPFALQTVSSYTLAGGTQLNTTTTTLITNVPEPASIMMFGSGLLGFAGMIRRKLNK